MPLVCALCKINCTPTVPGLKCTTCASAFHIKCISMDKTTYDLLKSTEGVEWKCGGCRNAATGIGPDNCNCCKIIPSLYDLIAKLSDAVDSLKKQVQDMNKTSADNNLELIIQEVFDRQKRAANLIFFGIPEQTAGTSISDCKTTDKNFVIKFINHADSTTDTSILINCFRLGKFNATQSTTKPRPVKVCFRDEFGAKSTLKKIRSQSDRIKIDNNFKNIIVSVDRTPLQNELFRKVKSELNDRIKNGEQGLKLKYLKGIPQIVRDSSVNLN